MKGRTSPSPLTRAKIVAAAVTLADEHGLERLSMRGVASRVRVEAMSLYNHVGGKDDLIDAMVDYVVGEIAPLARDAPWKVALRHRSLSAHEALTRHPWACPLIGLRLNVGPNMLAHTEAVLACLVEAGFSVEMADHGMNAIDNHVRGFTLHKLNFPIQPNDYAKAAEEYLPQLPPETYPHLRALAQMVMSGVYDGLNDFSFGLDLVLDGLERSLLSKGAESLSSG
ncbi:MAG: TetR/AcrR family transcriptional regulator C-terminal domain-containing protein [Beijerinckiaceae bacterium]|nr:TetR/AcrR family transcriptional regulator C-terminal domain-containing protein [Beijerinckiaceae bacterium]